MVNDNYVGHIDVHTGPVRKVGLPLVLRAHIEELLYTIFCF